jgi:hypothetical protein
MVIREWGWGGDTHIAIVGVQVTQWMMKDKMKSLFLSLLPLSASLPFFTFL